MRKFLLLFTALLPVAALAQTAPTTVKKVTIDTSPLGGGIPIAKFPHQVQLFSKSDLTRHGEADLTRTLAEQGLGVNLENSQANPYQPTILYHGFELSPIQGTPAGLSVYVNGARFNTPFGDLALWSLLPNDAIQSVNLEDGNPVFGLNALGGALDVKMKDGFTTHGGEIEVQGGSFGQVAGHLEYGKQAGNTAAYFDISAARSTGWRDEQGSDLRNFYGDLGWRSRNVTLHINATLAESGLSGPGTVPEQLLAADSSSQFTGPNSINDKYAKLATTLDIRLSDASSLQGVLYYENLHEHLVNGNGPNDLPCGDGVSLCQGGAGGDVSTALGGGTIPQYLPDGSNAYGQLNLNTSNTNGYGGSVQFTHSGMLGKLVAGLSYDAGFTKYGAAAYDGALTLDTRNYYALPGTGLGYEVDEPGTVPVDVVIRNEYAGAYASDTFNITKRLAITAGGRFNIAYIALHNERAPDPNAAGGGLNGHHYYQHFNPAVGATYSVTPMLTLYGGWSEQNAAPTPAELSCASPEDSCSLANFMSGDPNLKQIVSRNAQIGLRGATLFGPVTLGYDADAYDNNTSDDIEFLQSPYNPVGSGYFANIGNVRRLGVDAKLTVQTTRWQVYGGYSFISATYGSSFVEQTNSPTADANGNVTVNKGSYLPGIPQHLFKFGARYWLTPKWRIGLTGTAQTSSYLYGDEANQNKPLPGYVTLNLDTQYQVTKNLQIFGNIDNFTNTKYYNYGTFSTTGEVYVAQAPNYDNPRSYALAAPVAVIGGIKLTF